MMKGLYAVGLFLVAVLAAEVSSLNVHSKGQKPIQYYDWEQWISKNKDSKSSSVVGSNSKTSKGGYDWKQWLSNSYIQIPSGLGEIYSFSPYDWEQFLSTQQLGGIRKYDWQQWISKIKDDKSSAVVGSNSKTSKGGYDWKQWLSNSYIQIPSGLGEKYSFSPYDWEQFLSTQQLGGIRKYDWQQWISKNKDSKSSSVVGSNSKTSKGGYDWKQWLSNSYGQIPSGFEEKYSFSPYDWQQYLSTQQLGGIRKYDWQQWISKIKDDKSSSVVGSNSKTSKGGYDWKQWLSNSYGQIPSGFEEKYSFSPYDWQQYLSTQQLGGIRKYDWQQWISKIKDDKSSSVVGSNSKTSKGGYDWKQWLSNSYGQIPSGFEEKYSFSPYDWQQYLSTQQLGGIRKYDWQQWISKIKDDKSSSVVGSNSKTSKGGYDWKQWLSNSYGQIPSGFEEKYSFSPYDWQQYLSTQQLGGIRKYDWQQWISKNKDSKSSSVVGSNSKTSKGGYDWKQWLSNSYGQIPSGLEEKFSFSPYDWGQYLSFDQQADVRKYDWEQWLSNSYIPDDVQFYDWKQKFSKKSSTKNGGNTKRPKFSKSEAEVSKSNNGGKYDWKQWLSKSVDSSVEPDEVENSILSKSSQQEKGGYDWKQWLSKSSKTGSGSGSNGSEQKSQVSENVQLSQSGGSDVGSTKGGYDWKQWLSQSGGSGGDYDWKQWLAKSSGQSS